MTDAIAEGTRYGRKPSHQAGDALLRISNRLDISQRHQLKPMLTELVLDCRPPGLLDEFRPKLVDIAKCSMRLLDSTADN